MTNTNFLRGEKLMTDIVRGMTEDDFRSMRIPRKTVAALLVHIADTDNDTLDLRDVTGIGPAFINRIASFVADKYMVAVEREKALRAAMTPIERIPPKPAPEAVMKFDDSPPTPVRKHRKTSGKRRRVVWVSKDATPFEYIDVYLNGHQVGAYMDLHQVRDRVASLAENYDKVVVEYRGAGIAFTIHNGRPLAWPRKMSLYDVLRDWHRRSHPNADILG